MRVFILIFTILLAFQLTNCQFNDFPSLVTFVENFAQHAANEAAKMYEQALNLNDNDYLTWANLAAAQHWVPGKEKDAIDNYHKAIALAEKNLKINPNDVEIISNLASYYGDVDDSSKSMKLLQKSIKMAPDNANVMFRAATINEHFHNRKKALYWIKKALISGYSRSEIEHQPELKQLIADDQYKQIVKELNTTKDN